MFRNYIAAAGICAGILLCAGSTKTLAAAQSYSLDPSHTTVAFLVDHIGFAKTLGQFTDVSGSLSFDQDSNTVSNVNISVATQSVNTANEARDKHVKNKDFLNVKKFPEMKFSASSGSIDANGAGEIAGELTLLGNTLPLTLSVKLNKAEKYPFAHKRFTLGVSASGELNRSDYGMDYGVANALVGDAVTLIIEIEAIQDK
ncbi:MAG: YceI family protein [Granulosicoccus sp.]